jgi:hypothetical protein
MTIDNEKPDPYVVLMRKIVGVCALLAVEICAVVVLHRLGRLDWLRLPDGNPLAWLAANHPMDTFAAVIRPVALAAAVWMLTTTVLYGLACSVGSPATATLRRLTLPPVRRLVDGAVVFGLSTAIVSGPAPSLADDTPHPLPALASAPQPAQEPASAAALHRLGWPPLVDDVPEQGDDDLAPTHHVVVRGDNLWSIAASHLSAVHHAPSTADIADYWRLVLDANANSLHSGNPDLIFPGELVLLPPPPAESTG